MQGRELIVAPALTVPLCAAASKTRRKPFWRAFLKLTAEEIKERVDSCEADRAEYYRAAELWESMWCLQAFDSTPTQAIEQDGREQVTLPTPYNVVQLVTRLISDEPRIEVATDSIEIDDENAADTRERWLTAVWQRMNREAQRNLVSDAKWMQGVRGRGVFDTRWVYDQLPKVLQKQRLPFMTRVLDPMHVGVQHGPFYVEHAYHKYEQKRGLVRQQYPKLKLESKGYNHWTKNEQDQMVKVIDFWWRDAQAHVWNAVLVEDEFAKPPKKTDYLDIPIVEFYGDSAPLADEVYKGLSILHPIKDLWHYQCRLASQIGTGLLYYFWPVFLATTDGTPFAEEIEVSPGETYTLAQGQKIDLLRVDVNVPLAQAMLQQVDAAIQQSTFPGVMYGKEPGDVQAGYGVNILANQARGRINSIRLNLEAAIERVNAQILQLVETFGGKKGVKVHGRDAREGTIYHVTLTPKEIQGAYDNTVTLQPEVPQDDMQKMLQGQQLKAAGIISAQTARDKFIPFPLPVDEAKRIQTERAYDGPLAPKAQLYAIRNSFPNWETQIVGTPLQQVDETEKQYEMEQADAMAQGMNLAPPEPLMGPGMTPPFAPGGPIPPPMGPPEGGLPPEMLGNGGVPPPGPGPLPGGPLQPPGPMMGPVTGLPPEMLGQMTPEMLGDPNMPPEVFDALMNRRTPPAEQLGV